MEVLKRGKDKNYYITCPTCNSDLAYTQLDIHSVLKEDKCGLDGIETNGLFRVREYRLISTYEHQCVTCPECGREIDVPLSLPHIVSTRKEYL